MHTTTTESNTTSHLRSVRGLLAELDTMKNKGLGARERLEFILDGGADLVEEFDIEDAFDIEHRAMSRRLESLNDMKATLRQGQQQWRGGPVQEEVKEAAGRLLGHLDKFLNDAVNKEAKSEIEMLSQLWHWDPDISHIFPGLTSGRPKPKPLEIPAELPAELQEFTKKKAALYDEVKAEVEAHPHHQPAPGWQECPVPEEEIDEIDEIVDQFVEDHPGTTLNQMTTDLESKGSSYSHQVPKVPTNLIVKEDEPPKKFPLIKPEYEPEMRIVSMVPPRGHLAPADLPEEPDRLRQETWTAALREMTTDEWSFHRETNWSSPPVGRMASVLLWHADECEARLELTEMTDNHVKVNLRVLMRGRVRRRHEVLSLSNAVKLHLDPIHFVKRVLER